MYVIVEFNNGSCDMAPKMWLRGEKKCLWPPETVKSSDVSKFIRQIRAPKQDWKLHEVKILSEAATFDEAWKKARKAMSGSELSSDPENYGRGKRGKKRNYTSIVPIEDNTEFSTNFTRLASPVDSSDEENAEIDVYHDILKILPPPPIMAKRPCSSASLSIDNQSCSQEEIHQRPSSSISVTIDKCPYSNKELDPEFKLPSEPSTPVHKVQSDGAMKAVFRELTILRHNQNKIVDMISILMERDINRNDLHKEERERKLQQEFPLRSTDDIYKFEDVIEDHCYKNELLSRLKSLGGNNHGDHARRILRYLVTDELAEVFSFHGNKDKKRFSSLRLSETIIDAVVETHSVTRSQTEEIIKTWLRHAKERRLYQRKKPTE